MGSRLSYEASWKRIVDLGYLDGKIEPHFPAHRPTVDDEGPQGMEFFRTDVVGEDLSGLTLRRSYFGRCLIERTSFRNTDLTESSLCWNDFTDVRFDGAVLSGCDLRASQFDQTSFDHADLARADLRHSEFRHCTARSANLTGAVMTLAQVRQLDLSAAQTSSADIRSDDGPEPEGG